MSLVHDESTTHEHGLSDDLAAFRVVSDLRGIPVEDASGITIGSLFGALAEAATGLLRYLDLALTSRQSHVLVPIGHVRVREMPGSNGPHIRLRAALLEDLEQVPAMPPDVAHVDDPFERELLAAYGRTFHGERYYAHPAYDHTGLFVGEHLVVPEVTDADQPLMALSYLSGWRVAEGEPDIRGWRLIPDEAQDEDDDIVVRDLIVDPGAQKARYLVLELPEGSARLLPVGFARVDRPAGQVTAPGITLDDLSALPPWDGGGVMRDDEELLAAALRARLRGSRKYALPDFRA